MSVFSGVGTFLKGILEKVTKFNFQKPAILQELDTVYFAIKSIGDRAVDKQVVKTLTDVAKRIRLREYKSQTDREVLKVYETFKKALGRNANKESTAFLGSILFGSRLIVSDLDKVQVDAIKLFSDLKEKGDLKVSHSYILGYMHLAEMTAMFFNDMLTLLGNPQSTKVPPYVLARAQKNAVPVAQFMDALLNRLPSIDIMSDLKEIKSGGHDIYLISDDVDVVSYANDKDYSNRVKTGLSMGFVGNPFIAIGDMLAVWQRQRYERNKRQHEQISAKIAVMQMDLDGVDPSSPEYKKQMEIIGRYSNELASLDKKISEYENS